MGQQKQDIFTHECDNLSGWDRAIFEAERQIETTQEKIKRLKLSIETFKEMRTKGEPFPGETDNRKGLEA